ncbi:LysE family translocator [Nocardia sp. XZ_19_385]|uniref:LysE family translocator n=1 Tax=Nocardia sp. XZ_19_385 TaxID=2769488 RepID=UPI00188FA94F|nr:LysE family translocator [Nocardia sp. XZ_19_385]
MIPVANLLAFSAAAFIIIVVPGPGVLFAIGRALALGRRAAMLSVIGHSVGVLVSLLLVAIGLGTILTASALALTIVKFTGALYLIYLGVQAIRDRKSLRDALHVEAPSVQDTKVIRQGIIVGLTNPKAVIFFSAVLPHFIDPAAGAYVVQLLILGGIFLAIALVSDSAWALGAAAARGWFARSPRRLEAVGATGGAMIVGLGASVALSGAAK